MAHFHQFAGVIVEDCIDHYDGEILLGKLCWLQWCLGDLNVGFNACQYHLLIDCSYFSSTIRPRYYCFAKCVLGRAELGTHCALVRMEVPHIGRIVLPLEFDNSAQSPWTIGLLW
jgi:hypothetical protein